MRESSQTLADAAESLAGILGAIAAGTAVAGGITRLIPGSVPLLHSMGPLFLVGAALLLVSYLLHRRLVLLLGRATQAVLWSACVGVLLLLPALIRSPGDAVPWVVALAFSAVGLCVYRAAPRIRAAIEAGFP
jgi:hypothetical protein